MPGWIYKIPSMKTGLVNYFPADISRSSHVYPNGVFEGAIPVEAIDHSALAGYFLVRLPASASLKNGLSALFFSWAGDVLLMFNGSYISYWLIGLPDRAYFYIITFHRIRIIESIKSNAWLLLLSLSIMDSSSAGFPLAGRYEITGPCIRIVISFCCCAGITPGHKSYNTRRRLDDGRCVLFIFLIHCLQLESFMLLSQGPGLLIMASYGLRNSYRGGGITYISVGVKRRV